MLVLKRYAQVQSGGHPGESRIRIELSDGTVLTVALIQAGTGWARIGIEAPKKIDIYRQEYYDRLQQRYAERKENSEAATEDVGSAPGAYREDDRA